MTLPPPKIDSRTYAELVDEIEKLAQQFSQWKPSTDGSHDAGRPLIRIFGRMAMMVADRLNRVPEKHFLAFLNLIGARQQPPRPARVPLTAYLVDNSPVDALIPAHTQITASPQAGETEEGLFETEQDLVVVRSQLKAAIVHKDNQYCDHILTATTATGDFPVFEIEQPNTIYIAADQLTTKVDSKEIQLAIDNPRNLTDKWEWSYWDGETWQELTPKADNNKLILTLPEFSKEWKPPQPKVIEGVEAQWLRGICIWSFATLDPQLVRAAIQEVPPDQAFFNTEEIDLSKDFLPLGEAPKIGDTFYISKRETLANAGATIKVELTKSQGNSPKPNAVKILWEVWTDKSWKSVLKKDATSSSSEDEFDHDLEGTVEFKLPAGIIPVEVNGEENYWVRVRLAAGNYGSEPQFVTKTTNNGNETKTTLEKVTDTGYFPPSLKSITLSRNELNTDPKDPKDLKALPSGAFLHKDADPFSVPEEDGLYLRFDRLFPNQTIALYLQIAPPEPGALRNSTPPETPAKLQWEYSVSEGWRSLSVQDGAQNLSQRGMVQFIGPADFAPRTLFGQSGYWLRLRLLEGDFQIQPRLQRVLTNTVWAVQATTHQDEILGSGTGDPNLALHTLYTPVLPGQQLLVRESELPSAEEQKEIKELEGEDAIAISKDASGQLEEIWVRWHEVSDFYGSGSRDRHYTLDRMTGEIRFGGEGQGLPPPVGRNNIRMACYQSGGGSQGNRAAETLTDLKTTVPYVDRVINHEPASGGANVEPIAAVQESGPKQLRHGDRAVTWQDIEDLTYAASSEIARVKVIPPRLDAAEGIQWLPIYPLEIKQSGTISVTATIEDSSTSFAISLYGAGKSTSYASKEGTGSVILTYEVEQTDLQPNYSWNVQLTQTGEGTGKCRGQITLTKPDGLSEQHEVELPAKKQTATTGTTQDRNPFTDFSDAGTVKVLIVPQSQIQQPIPSLTLIEQVKHFLSDRVDPSLTLEITEPPWVEVTVTATVAPLTLAAANGLKAVVTEALTAFLHPLTGGINRTGWSFGRQPYLSDVYAFLERLADVNHVEITDIQCNPRLNDRSGDNSLPVLNETDQDRFLIYSGKHDITIDSPPP